MPTYKLYYFNVTARAEPIRYLLSYCGIPFEDIRWNYEGDDEWQKYKAETPMERLPVLEVDGVKFHQHLAICRYIARNNGIGGSNEAEICKMDAVVEDINDLRTDISKFYTEKDPSIQAVLKERVFKMIPFYMDKFESRVANNGGFFFGEKISWVDIYYAATIEFFSSVTKENLEKNYPNLKKVSSAIRAHKMIAPYIASCPGTIV